MQQAAARRRRPGVPVVVLRAVVPPVVVLMAGLVVACSAPEPSDELALTAVLGLAEVETETEGLELGTPGARPFLLEGWSFNQRGSDGRSFVWGLGQRSVLRLVVGEPRDLRLRFRCRPGPAVGDAAPALEVWVGGRSVGRTPLRPEFTWYTVPVPADVLRPGGNRVEFVYGPADPEAAPWPLDPDRQAVACERLEVVGAGSYGLPETHIEDGSPALRIPHRASLAYYWNLPRGGELGLDELRPWPDANGDAAGGLLEVEIQPADAPEPETFRLEPGGGGARRVPLPASETGPVRVVLRARVAGAPPSAPAGLDLLAPVLRTPRGVPSPEPSVAAAPLPDVFVYVIDTLRPDHLGAYGYDRPTSPHIDAFARDATLFVDAVAQASWTRPAVASIFTGQHPPTHGVVRANRALAEEIPFLPEMLQQLGYQTWGIITNGNVAPAFGFGRGFERYRYLPEGRPGEMHQLSDAVNELAFGWLESRRQTGPLFFYLHTTDPHSPYAPRSPFREKLAGAVADAEAGSRPYMRRLQLGERPPRGARAAVKALYDAEIAFNDASFGAFIEMLKQRGLYESSLIVLLSDHGEAFAEHGSWQHGTTLYDEVLAIPLIIKFPDGLGRGARVTTTARQVDVLPTVLDVLGQPIGAGVEGRSLLGDARGEPGPPVTAFSHLLRKRGEWESASQGRRKLIRTTAADDGTAHVRLFDLEKDPRERRDLAAEDRVWRGYLLSQLRHLESLAGAGEEAPAADIDPALRERLEALGYM